MNAFERINALIRRIEEEITATIEPDEIARIMACPVEQFGRIFAFIAGMTLADYVRRRRLTLSAFELQQGTERVIDIAARYGYDSHAAFTRAFRDFHGISPSAARRKDAVLTIQQRLALLPQTIFVERGNGNMGVLGKVDILVLPEARMIGVEVMHGGGQNPVPTLWARIFKDHTLDALHAENAVLDLYIGWMGEYQPTSNTFTYIAGYLMPAGTVVPEGFSYRDVQPCQVGLGFINGDFADGTIFAHSHEMTVDGIRQAGYVPDYSFGWSAEAYPKDLSFDAEEGTINYICPCKREPEHTA